MSSKQIVFLKMRIIRESSKTPERFTYPTKENFGNIPQEPEIDLASDNGCKSYIENTDEYFWLAVEYNTPNPRRNTIYDIKTKKERPNDRGKNEVELSKQAFFLYHYSSGILCATTGKVKILKHCLEKYNKDDIYKPESIFESREEFIRQLDKVREISFADGRGLLGELHKYLNILTDFRPDDFKISLQYQDWNKNKLISLIKDLFHLEEKCSIDNLLIKGIDENSFDIVFNKQTFVQKITIEVDKTDEGICDQEIVKKRLLEEIKKE